jgi:exopolysaccharide biosynthesis polyprenyl glycosylphosphotransferase
MNGINVVKRNIWLVWRLRSKVWIIIDSFCSAISILIAYARQPNFRFTWNQYNFAQPGPFQACIIYILGVTVSMQIMGLYENIRERGSLFTLLRLGLAVFIALILTLLFFYSINLQHIGRTILLITFILTTLFIGLNRVLLSRIINSKKQKIGYILPKLTMERLRILINQDHPYLELLESDTALTKVNNQEIVQNFLNAGAEEVVVSYIDKNQSLWLSCLNRGMQVTDIATFIEREFYKVPVDDITLSWIATIDLKWNHPTYHRVKRALDILLSVLGLVISSPIVILSLILILIESGRPVFYSQIRIGFMNKPYRIWKIRTMKNDAEISGARWAEKNDSRITLIGRILRKSRIDEIPQFWNVIKGEMSIIGPRPERPEFVSKLVDIIPLYSQRHWTKPGITGWAQINFPYGSSVGDAREKLCYDLYYLKNASIILDLQIILRTIAVIAKGSR